MFKTTNSLSTPKPTPKPSPKPSPKPLPPTLWCNIKEKKYCDPGYYCHQLDNNPGATSPCLPCKCDVPGYTADPCRPYYRGPNELVDYPEWCNLDEKNHRTIPPIEQICDGKGTTNPLVGTKCDENGLCPDGTRCPQPGDGETQGMCPSKLCVPECMSDKQALERGIENSAGYWWDPTVKNACLQNNWSPPYGQLCDGTCSPCRCENEWQKPNTGIATPGDPLNDVCNGSESSQPECVNICPPGKYWSYDYGLNHCADCIIQSAPCFDKMGNFVKIAPLELSNTSINPHTKEVMNMNEVKQKFCNGWPAEYENFNPSRAYPYWVLTGCPTGFYLDKTKNQNSEYNYSCYSCECPEGTSGPPNYKGCAVKDGRCVTNPYHPSNWPKYLACGKTEGSPNSQWGAGCAEISGNDKVDINGPTGVDCAEIVSDLGTPSSGEYAHYNCTPYGTISCENGVCRGDSDCHWFSCCYNLCEKQ